MKAAGQPRGGALVAEGGGYERPAYSRIAQHIRVVMIEEHTREQQRNSGRGEPAEPERGIFDLAGASAGRRPCKSRFGGIKL